LRKRVCATPEERVADASVFISRWVSPKPPSTPRSPVASLARRPRRGTGAKENGLFYALSFEASFDAGVRRRSSTLPRELPAETLSAISAAVARKKNRRGC